MRIDPRFARRTARVCVLAAAALFITAGIAGANVSLTRVSVDPFTNSTSQHATEVEPDTFAHHGTVVATFQVGRFFNGGATDTGFVRSGDGGTTWDAPGFLPGLTFNAGADSPYERVSDPSVAYDAAHSVWIISSLPLLPSIASPTVLISRSTDDGRTWGNPVSIPPPIAHSVDLDKNWTVCDNHSTAFQGHCYTEFDNFGEGDRLLMSTSTDGGLTWSTPIETAGHDKGIGGQPLVQPDGTVVVPFEGLNQKIGAFLSKDGGASWTKASTIAGIRFHDAGGGLRTSPLPTAEIDGTGNVYVAWEDCRFRPHCAANDIVFSKSSDGVHWSDPARVPIDAVTSGVDHFIPGLAVNPSSSGVDADLALTYYFYPDASCSSTCRLTVGYISSPDGGAHWGNPIQLAGPMALSEIAQTSQGPMVGDYISTSFSGGLATTVFAVGQASPLNFDEAMFAPTSPLPVTSSAAATRASSSAGVVGGEETAGAHQAPKRR